MNIKSWWKKLIKTKSKRPCDTCGGWGTVACGLDPYWPCCVCETKGYIELCGERNNTESDEPCLHDLPCPIH